MNKKISIVIPVYNEETYLKEVFESLEKQDYDKNLTEIIFVDGNSSDNSENILKEYQLKNSNVKIFANPQKIVPVSMNIGIKNAEGFYIIRMDSHTKYSPDYVSKCVEVLEKTNADNVGGAIRLIGDNKIQKAIKLATTCPFGIGNSSFHYEDFEGYVDTVYLGAYRKDFFYKTGFYDEELVRNQDDELNYRLIKNGGKIYMSKEIISYYYPRPSLKKLWKQYYEYGYWKVRVIQKHKFPASIRHLIPVTFVLSLLFSFLALFITKYALILLFMILFPYFLGLTFFTLKQSLKEKYTNFITLASVFIILHLSYGSGFLKGIIDFYIRKK